MRIVMVGAGYVGLVSGACLADFGHEVVCVEVDESKVESLRQGHVPIYEPGLSELAVANQARGRLSFTMRLAPSARLSKTSPLSWSNPPSRLARATRSSGSSLSTRLQVRSPSSRTRNSCVKARR